MFQPFTFRNVSCFKNLHLNINASSCHFCNFDSALKKNFFFRKILYDCEQYPSLYKTTTDEVSNFINVKGKQNLDLVSLFTQT